MVFPQGLSLLWQVIAYRLSSTLPKASCEIDVREAEPVVSEGPNGPDNGDFAEEFAPALLPLLAIQGDGAAMSNEGASCSNGRSLSALQALLLQGSRRRPLILILENLHWMDTTSEELLTSLVDSILALPVLLLTTYRPGYSPPWGDRSHHTRLILESLSEEECVALVEELLHTQAVGADVHAFIFKQAEGNPFYVEELTKSLLEIRALEQYENGYVLTQGALQGKIPDTIQNVIAARIDRLPEKEKRIVQAVAVISGSSRCSPPENCRGGTRVH
jgi:predicted ATPase